MRRIPALLLLCALAAGAVGCIAWEDPLGRQHALDYSQRRYTQLVRWGEYEEASEFVAPELRASFVDNTEALSGFRITDYKIGRFAYGSDGDEATVKVTYRGYAVASLIEQPVKERQVWYRAGGNSWLVRPAFESLVAPFDERKP